MNCYLILEDGTAFAGKSIGSEKTVICEVVFNTSMTGYLEVLTDPSYAGQAVLMTYPLIGNYGLTPDMESDRSYVSGYIVREVCDKPSNFRCEGELETFLKQQDIPGICGIDTRALTKIIRDKGCMNAMITTDGKLAEPFIKGHDVAEPYYINDTVTDDMKKTIEDIKAYRIGDVVSLVTTKEKKHLPGNGKKVALLDLGAKSNIAKSLNERGCDVTIYPAGTKAEEILGTHPDGIMLSNGPGDPKDRPDVVSEIRRLYESDTPIFAICLGHQMMALAAGADTHKLKYGHHGGNHPVKDLETGRVYITSQNHNYVVDTDSMDPKVAVPAFVNVNDGTNEGLKYTGKNIFTVQFHPEACPGPRDSAYLFDRFINMMGGDE